MFILPPLRSSLEVMLRLWSETSDLRAEEDAVIVLGKCYPQCHHHVYRCYVYHSQSWVVNMAWLYPPSYAVRHVFFNRKIIVQPQFLEFLVNFWGSQVVKNQ